MPTCLKFPVAPFLVLACTVLCSRTAAEELTLIDGGVRSVDDVAPALRNATTNALSGAQSIIASSSDFLIAAAIPVGALATFFGYFLLGPVLFTTAFFIGGGACFVAVRAGLSNSEASAWLSIIAMLVGGGFSGFAACRMLALGMFAVGACLGVAISAALKVILWTRVFPASPHAGFIFGSTILGIIFGFTALSLRKQMLILSTSYAGAFGMFFGIGHFAGHFPTLKQLNQVEQGMFDPWALGYLALTALFGTAGMFLQLHMTRDKPMPSQAPYSRRQGLRRVRQTSNSSDWTADGDEEWERALLEAESRIERESALSRSNLQLGLEAGGQESVGEERTRGDIEAPREGRKQSLKQPATRDKSPTSTWNRPVWDVTTTQAVPNSLSSQQEAEDNLASASKSEGHFENSEHISMSFDRDSSLRSNRTFKDNPKEDHPATSLGTIGQNSKSKIAQD